MVADLTAQVAEHYELPGGAVFPESIGVDAATGDAYVGSLADRTLYRLAAGGGAQVWSPPGQDGRGSAAGVKADSRGKLCFPGHDRPPGCSAAGRERPAGPDGRQPVPSVHGRGHPGRGQ